MIKKHFALLALLSMMHTIQPDTEESKGCDPIAALLDTCQKSREKDGTPDFYSYQLGSASWMIKTIKPNTSCKEIFSWENVPFSNKVFLCLGITSQYDDHTNSMYCRSCCFRDKTFEEK